MQESFWLTLKNYWHNGLTAWTMYVLLIILITFILLSIIINLMRAKSEETAIIKLLSSLYLSGVFTTALTLLVVIWLMQFTTFFGKYFCQMGFLLGFLSVGVFTIMAYAKLCRLGKAKDSNALGLPVTPAEQQTKLEHFKTYAWSLWLWSLSLALPFTILFIPDTSKHLISIVLDNSGSMYENLKQCTRALEIALLPTHKHADYVFTTIDYTKDNTILDRSLDDAKKDNKTLNQFVSQYFDDFVNQKTSHRLATNTVVYNDALSLFNSFSQMGIAEEGSPVYEGIWQNYLTSRELSQNSTYVSKKMIVITDGEDNLYGWLNYDIKQNAPFKLLKKDIFQQQGKIGETAGDFFNSICFINYGDYNDDLMFADCSNSINETYDGTNAQSYFDAFRSILPEMFFDILFLYMLIGIAALLSLIILIIKFSTL